MFTGAYPGPHKSYSHAVVLDLIAKEKEKGKKKRGTVLEGTDTMWHRSFDALLQLVGTAWLIHSLLLCAYLLDSQWLHASEYQVPCRLWGLGILEEQFQDT